MGKKLDNVKEEVAVLGWSLLSNTYTNKNTLMRFLCPNGHEVECSLEQWRKRQKCPVCEHKSQVPTKPQKTNRVLALDAATQITGWAVFDDGKLVSYGKFAAKGAETANKIYDFAMWLIGVIGNWCPDYVVIEDIQQQNNVQVFKTLAKLQGVIEFVLLENSVDFSFVSSNSWKSYSEVRGRTRVDQKKSAQLKVVNVYGINGTEDESDAILLGRYAVDKLLKTKRMVNFEGDS